MCKTKEKLDKVESVKIKYCSAERSFVLISRKVQNMSTVSQQWADMVMGEENLLWDKDHALCIFSHSLYPCFNRMSNGTGIKTDI